MSRRQVKAKDVRRELHPGTSTALLKELHLLTRTGDLNADALRKLKQVNHLANLLAPAIDDVLGRFGEPVLVDCGAGKSALGFILYELFLKGPGSRARLVAVESRADLARGGAERARKLGFDRLEYVESPIAGAPVPARVHLVTALHACDTATDDALALAVFHGADHVAVVPCCQAEVARQLGEGHPSEIVAPLFEHPWHRREFGSHLTNVLRALALEAAGYRVTVTELAGWEHSLKNELILGKKVRASNPAARAKLDALLAATGVKPSVLKVFEPAPVDSGPA